MNKKISDYLTPAEILAQMAEEAAELAQAALKLRRAMDNTNPTPKSIGECGNNLIEEYADVLVCLRVFSQSVRIDWNALKDELKDIGEAKYARWLTRLQEAHHDEPDL